MPTYPAKDFAASLTRFLAMYEGLDHIRVRSRGSVLTLESGPDDDPVSHARLRRDTVHLWTLEMAGRGGRWEKTPFRGPMDDLVTILVEQFGWCLESLY